MDPTATLDEIRKLIEEDQGGTDPELADRILALDLWLSKGGFLPKQWSTTTRENVGPEANVEQHAHGVMPVDRGDVIGHLFHDHGFRSNVLGHKNTAQLRQIHEEAHR